MNNEIKKIIIEAKEKGLTALEIVRLVKRITGKDITETTVTNIAHKSAVKIDSLLYHNIIRCKTSSIIINDDVFRITIGRIKSDDGSYIYVSSMRDKPYYMCFGSTLQGAKTALRKKITSQYRKMSVSPEKQDRIRRIWNTGKYDSVYLAKKFGIPIRTIFDIIYKDNPERKGRVDHSYTLTLFGETKTLREWSRDKRCLVRYIILNDRYHDGMRDPRILEPEDLLKISGESKTLSEWAIDPRCEIGLLALKNRYRMGRRDEMIIKNEVMTLNLLGETKTLLEWIFDRRCEIGTSEFYRRFNQGVRTADILLTTKHRTLEICGEKKTIRAWILDERCPLEITSRELIRRYVAGIRDTNIFNGQLPI